MNLLRHKWFYPSLLLLLVIFAFGAYFKVLYAEFVYDDFGFIVNNKSIQSFTPFSKFLTDPNIFTGSGNSNGAKNWRPIASLAFAIEYFLFGARPFGYHLISILLHLVNIFLVYFLLKKITSRLSVTIIVTSLWASHPVLTEAISWASNQSSLIFFTLFILSILALLEYRENLDKKIFLVVSYLFFSASLLTKETALGGIFVIFIIFLFYFKKHYKAFTPFVVIGAAYVFIRYQILGSLGDHVLRGSFLENLLLAPLVFFKYIGLAVWPLNLLLDYSNYPLPSGFLDFRVIFGILFFIIFSLLIWFGMKKSLFSLSLGTIWFVALLLPVLQIIPFQDIIGERFLYAPLAGLILTLILGLDKAIAYVKARFYIDLNKVSVGVFVLILLVFFILTSSRNNDWLNSENLWLSVLKIDNRNGRALQNLSAFYLQKGEVLKIIEFSKRLIDIDPENRAGHLHLAVGYILNGRYGEAESKLLDLIKKYPDFKEAQNNLLVLYRQLGKADNSIQSVIVSPEIEGNVITSGIFGKIVLNNVPYEASLNVLSRQNILIISIRSHSDGTFQIPLKPGIYKLVLLDPDGPIKPVRNDYNFVVNNGEWLQMKIEYR